MINLIQALIKARAEFPSIQKDKVNPHFKVSYASLDSVLDAVTPALCKHGLAIVQLMEKGNILKTHLFHESGEVLTSEYELPDIQENQKKGAALTYARRYSVCALLSITADEDDDGNATKDEQKNNSKTKPSNNNNSLNNVIDLIRQVREFLGVDKQYVIDWLAKNNTTIADLKNPDQLMKDMCIDRVIAQGVDEFYALESYVENVKSPNLTSIQKWKQTLGDFNSAGRRNI
jgi:hypothetical protein